MKLQLHPASLLAGAALFASILALSSAAPQTVINGSPGVIQHDIAHPRTFVEIKEGVPFTVRNNRLFVVTNLGWDRRGISGDAVLLVNGSRVVATGSSHPSVQPIGRFVCQPGDIVEAVDGSAGDDYARAWGFETDL